MNTYIYQCRHYDGVNITIEARHESEALDYLAFRIVKFRRQGFELPEAHEWELITAY